MTEKSISTPNGLTTLTVVVKDREQEQARLIPIKKPETIPASMLPPQPEKYIKAKKHDFL